MPTFCRHGRFEASCAICRQEKEKAEPKTVTPRAKGTAARRPSSSVKSATGTSTRSRGVVTGKLQRAADDGFRSELLPGIRSTTDALALITHHTRKTRRKQERWRSPPPTLEDLRASILRKIAAIKRREGEG